MPPEESKKNLTLRERLQQIKVAMRNVPRSFALVWQAHPAAAIGMGLVALITALVPAAQAWVSKLIIDAVVNLISAQATLPALSDLSATQILNVIQPIAPYLLLEFGLITASSVLSQVDTLLEHVLHARLSNTLNTAIIRKALALDLHYFEDAQFYDKLQNARREADFRALDIMNTGFQVVRNVVSLTSFIVLLARLSPWITLLLFAATVPAFLASSRFSELRFRLLSWRAPEARRMNYLEHLLTVDESAKEVKLFGLGELLLKRYQEFFWRFYREDTRLAVRNSGISVGFGLLSNVSFYLSFAYIAYRTITRAISIGDMTMFISLCRSAMGVIQGMFYNVNRLYESGLFMTNLFGFLELQPQMKAGSAKRVPRPIKQGIEFRGVSFKYFGKDSYALRNVNLRIAPSEKLALVGLNGAGKTTLIKLLTRLYDPTEGQILLDGVDLREYDLDDLRQNIGVIFQDFVRYQTTARENIGFGQVNALDDEKRILNAAERGGADEVIDTLPKRYDTMLGRWFERGSELSGGQWQKIALGRAFMRDSAVLVLDEPTAALDAEREYEIFQRFRELTAGKIAILISHRFSTVRMADQIVVLENGTITEQGSHEALLAQGGTYARLFNLQAQGYR
jgi:ATP-binding cassette subfamily B protein